MNDQEKEISIKDLLRRTRQVVKYLFSKWLIIGCFGILGGLLGLFYAFHTKPKYEASLNFVLSSNTNSSGNILGLASQFGLNLGSDDDVFSGDNIIALMESRRMVQQALFGKPLNNDQSLINIFIADSKLNEAWEKKDRTKNAFPFPADADSMTKIQDSLARKIYTLIKDQYLDVSKPDKNQSIYAVTTTSKNELFSYYLTKYLVQSTSAFYIATKTSTAKDNLSMLQHEADSIKNVLGNAITSAGSFNDQTFNLNPAYSVQRSGAQQSTASATALGQAYGQVLQNLEIAKITLQKETPLYQVIDEPTLPLEADKPSKLISLIVDGFLAALITSLILLTGKLYRFYKNN